MGKTEHSDSQLWRFERQINHPKGVHSIISISGNQRMLCEEVSDEEGQPFMDVNFIDIQTEQNSRIDIDSSTSFISEQEQGILFMVFIDVQSEDGDILIKFYDPDSASEKFFCVDIGSGGIDFFEPETYASTRFVLNIPSHQVIKSSFEISELNQQRKVLYKNFDYLTNKARNSKEMIVKPPLRVDDCDQSIFSDTLTIKRPDEGHRQPTIQVGNVNDQVQIEIDDSKLSKDTIFFRGSLNLGKDFGCKNCSFTYEPQMFDSQL